MKLVKLHYKKSTFTLIELLVVITIIAILVTILIPSISRARKEATKAVCLSNLKQISILYSIYTDDNDGLFPQHSYSPPIGDKGDLFDRNGEETLGISRCPGDNGAYKSKVGKTKKQPAWKGSHKTSYKCAAKRSRFGIDWIISVPGDTKNEPRRITSFDKTSNKLFMGDIYEPTYDEWQKMQWHGGKNYRSCNILYLDSHAAFYRFPTEYNSWPLNKTPDPEFAFY